MDRDGVAADVMFAGGQNGEVLPFLGLGLSVGPDRTTSEEQSAGCTIFNRWLADFVSVAPERHVAVMQIPIWNLDDAIDEMRSGRESGLKAVNLPAPRRMFPIYNDPIYEPFWSAWRELDLPLLCHASGGEAPLERPARRAGACSSSSCCGSVVAGCGR